MKLTTITTTIAAAALGAVIGNRTATVECATLRVHEKIEIVGADGKVATVIHPGHVTHLKRDGDAPNFLPEKPIWPSKPSPPDTDDDVEHERRMIVLAVERALPDQHKLEEADALKHEADEMKISVARMRLRLAQTTPFGSGMSKDAKLAERRANERTRTEIAKLERKAKGIAGRAMKLRRDANAVRHIITGYRGECEITLTTKTDLSRKLRSIGPGDTVTWDGRPNELDALFETWTISYIEEINR